MLLLFLQTSECTLREARRSHIRQQVGNEHETEWKQYNSGRRIMDSEKIVGRKMRMKHYGDGRPVIGIFTQPYNETNDHIMAAYVKFVENAGARAVPIVWRDPDEDILSLVSKINGIIFPGGGTAFKNEDGSLTEHSRKVELVLNKVKEFNDQGVYYPILGICMGMQQIAQSEAPYKDTVELYKFDSNDDANNVTLWHSVTHSKLFNVIPNYLINALQSENITYNHHHDGIFPSIWNKYPILRDHYYLLGTSYDEKGVEYVALIESKHYPIWGLQFHPEKPLYDWNPDLQIPHSPSALQLSQFLSDFFIRQASYNSNKFDSAQDAFDHTIEQVAASLPMYSPKELYIFNI
ncbi:unnamed protein product [Moneuplotes crassus]|uniref:folate gamma-glutamyl hydrolase n=1 Tax=Euplotes crassus TaxID=5936 RepID=A0AAD1UNP0_EUPCR|nr:unnamed protein product [Moneuplotes crassus]